MLTTETLYRAGQRPVASVGERNHIHAVTAAVVGGAAEIAVRLRARLVAVMSHTGHTALAMSKQRNFIPVVGISDSQATLRQMALFWGVVPVPGISTDDPTRMLAHLDEWGKRDGCIHTGDRIVVITGDRLIRGAHNVVEVHEVP
jgi:pyruvate kinase